MVFRTEQDDRRKRIAGEVRAVMARQKITASALSAKVGIPPATLSRKLNAKAGFTAEELLNVADALDVSPGSLLGIPESGGVT